MRWGTFAGLRRGSTGYLGKVLVPWLAHCLARGSGTTTFTLLVRGHLFLCLPSCRRTCRQSSAES
ncbi:hypothetical protein BDW66DRAFT_121772 [Aspergillus desertorum]